MSTTSTSSFPFLVTEHIVDGQYIREYPRATISQSARQKLAVKKYTPLDNQNPQPGDVTIVGAHGGGFPKELYEPLWEDLLAQSEASGFRIGSIWVADTANLGVSGILNEDTMGDDPSWLDHSRDLLCMINHFRDEMPRPIIGVGHSMGAGQLALLSLMHPRLFTSLILMEPVIVPDTYSGYGPMISLLSLKRRDTWPSRSAAIEAARRTYRRWDPRVFERWIENAYRDLPTVIHPRDDTNEVLDLNPSDPPVTLASSKHQEVMQYIRPNFGAVESESKKFLAQSKTSESLLHDSEPVAQPDVIGPLLNTTPFYRSEPAIAWKLVDHLRPSVLYIFGERSPISTTFIRTELTQRTGAGVGGSGGVKKSRVKEHLIMRSGHQAPLEDVRGTASAIGKWIGPAAREWEETEKRIAQGWENQSAKDRLIVSAEWLPALQSACQYFAEASKL